jgi:hypothetical protein
MQDTSTALNRESRAPVIMMRFLLLGVASLICLWSMDDCVAGAMDSNELLSSCEAFVRLTQFGGGDAVSIPYEGAKCWYYFSAVQDFAVIVDETGRPYVQFCAPPDTKLSQLIWVFVNFAEDHPQELHRPPGQLWFWALTGAYPCAEPSSRL